MEEIERIRIEKEARRRAKGSLLKRLFYGSLLLIQIICIFVLIFTVCGIPVAILLMILLYLQFGWYSKKEEEKYKEIYLELMEENLEKEKVNKVVRGKYVKE
jgi:predicted membrane protein